MNIIAIALKEMKSDLRDKRAFIFMILFPLALVLILGTALSQAFNNDMTIDDSYVLYKMDTSNEASAAFEQFAAHAEKSGIHFKALKKDQDGKKEVKEQRYTAYVEVKDGGIHLYGNEENSIEFNMVQGMLSTFVDKYNVAMEVAKVNPQQVENLLRASKHDYIQETSLHSQKQPNSIDYYAISMTTMIVLYGSISASYLIRGERMRNTANRLVAAPIKTAEIFVGKILGTVLVHTICVLVVIMSTKYFFDANWGNHLLLVLVMLVSQILFAISFGLGVSYLTKTEAAARAIIMVVIQVSCIVGGTYFQNGSGEGFVNVSPLTWMNNGLIKLIYTNDIGASLSVIGLNVGFSILFLGIAIVLLRKREGL
ncbi:ABC transporter permease [Priestia aryabhattai]|uniref:ABC transporter permease n=1 Tax=Priestia TaxID=2800373 RepID=UPI000BF4AB0A|nr:ABC transporter permease [Priestia aryabhattai]PFW75434.1 ABC transporter permease [Priestia aryabhattai]